MTLRERIEAFWGLFDFGSTARVLPMEGVRGLAALLVFLVHASNHLKSYAAPGLTTQLVAWMEVAGQAGVDLFFALSGYLVYGLAMERMKSPGSFVLRRLQRIYPPFLTVLALYLCLFLALPERAKWPETGRAWYVIQNMLLLPGVFDLKPAVQVSWSLSYELLFYLTVPLMALAARAWPRRRRVGAIVLMTGVYVALSVRYFPGAMESLPFFAFRHANLIEFAAGMLAWEARGAAGRRWDWPAAAMLTAAICATVPLADPRWQASMVLPVRATLLGAASVLLALAAYGPADGQRWLARALSWRPLRLMGNVSYSFYLIHSLGVQATVWVAAKALPPDQWQGAMFWLLTACALGVSLALAAVLFLGVEKRWSLRR